MPFDGLAIEHNGRKTRLKWHRLRRRLSDPLFSAEVMAEGFRLGASMELDLRVRADGGFVVLHDESLDRETTGGGIVAQRTRADMRDLEFADSPRPLIFSEDLASMLKAAHPDALLQFDMKDDYAAIGERGIAHLAEYFSNIPASVIVSAHDPELIEAAKEHLPGLRRGIDPSPGLGHILETNGLAEVGRTLLADLRGPSAPDTVYLYWELILAARRGGLDLIDLCHSEGKLVDAWTFTLSNPEAGFSDTEWEVFHQLIDLQADQITTDEAIATEAAWHARAQNG